MRPPLGGGAGGLGRAAVEEADSGLFSFKEASPLVGFSIADVMSDRSFQETGDFFASAFWFKPGNVSGRGSRCLEVGYQMGDTTAVPGATCHCG